MTVFAIPFAGEVSVHVSVDRDGEIVYEARAGSVARQAPSAADALAGLGAALEERVQAERARASRRRERMAAVSAEREAVLAEQRDEEGWI